MTRRVPEASIVLNGETYVALSAYEQQADTADARRRTLALVHMHLVMGQDVEAAVARIRQDTGYTVEDARAVASLVAWASEPRDTMSQ